MRTNLLHALVAGAVAGIAAVIYIQVYGAALAVDFSPLVSSMGAISSSLIGAVLAGLGHHFWHKWVKRNATLWFNIIFAVLTFLSIMPIFGMTLPLEMKSPELLPGMVIPTHFFPILFWLVSAPLFAKSEAAG